ncbi:MAG: hypothetical protein P8129_10700 [Anaerolineae bacterium]
MKKVVVKAMLLTTILTTVGAQPALAYIDPNTGGMLFQMLAVLFASLSAILLFFSRQIRTFVARVLRSLRGKPAAGAEEEGAAADAAPPPDTEE